MSKTPAWWPTAEDKVHADAACAHPNYCNVGPADNFGVRIVVGDRVRVVHWGWAVRLTDTGRTAIVTGFTRAGNVVLDSSAYAPDLIAGGRAVKPTTIGVLDRSDRDNRVAAGYEGNRHLYRRPVAEDADFYDGLHDSIPSDVPDTVWESDALSKGAGA